MGWTSLHKDYGMSIDDFFTNEFESDDFKFIGKGALVNMTEYYRAGYIPSKKQYFAFVCKVHFSRDKEYNFSYKDMDESVNPYYYNCPARIMKIVEQSEPCNDWSKKWRETVHKVLSRKEMVKSLAMGTVIKFKKPFYFGNGCEEDTFRIVNNNPFGKRKTKGLRSVNHGFCANIPNWKGMDFEVVERV